MDPINIQMIIDGCQVNNQKARSLLFQQVYTIGVAVAANYASTDAGVDAIISKAYLNILDNLSFYDGTKIPFKSWVKQVVTDIGVDTISDPGRAVYALQAIEGFNREDISKRMTMPVAEVERLFNESSSQVLIASPKKEIDTTRMEASWAGLLPVIEKRYISDETVSMPFRARARQRIKEGGWIGWSILIGLSAIVMMALHFSGVIPGKKFAVRIPPDTHIPMGIGFALPCPNH